MTNMMEEATRGRRSLQKNKNPASPTERVQEGVSTTWGAEARTHRCCATRGDTQPWKPAVLTPSSQPLFEPEKVYSNETFRCVFY